MNVLFVKAHLFFVDCEQIFQFFAVFYDYSRKKCLKVFDKMELSVYNLIYLLEALLMSESCLSK